MSSTTTTKQDTTADPWAAAQPALKSLLSNSQQLYNSGTGFNPYGSSTVAPFSSQTSQALQGMQGVAGQGDPTGQAAYNNAQGVISSGGMNQGQWNALGGTYGVATGQNGINTGQNYQDILNQSSNPYYQQTVDREAGKLTSDISREFSNGGRYGSAAHSGAIADQVGGFRASMANANYNQGLNNQLNAVNGMTGVQGQNISNMMNAGQGFNSAVNQGQQLAGQYSQMSPQLYSQLYAPSQMLGQVGSAYDAQNQAQLSDQVNQWTQAQQAPWNRLSAMGNVALGAGGLGGTTSGTSTQTQPFNPLQAIGGIGSSVLPFFY